jgi:Flp pilus assembly protein TadG
MTLRFLRFRADQSGVSAVEFSLVAPILVAMVIATIEGGLLTMRSYDTRAALNAGAQYIMQGGTSSTAAQAIIMSAWSKKSADATASVTQSCKCGATVNVCSTLCADGTVPMSYYALSAQMTSKGIFTTNVIKAQDTVRVR